MDLSKTTTFFIRKKLNRRCREYVDTINGGSHKPGFSSGRFFASISLNKALERSESDEGAFLNFENITRDSNGLIVRDDILISSRSGRDNTNKEYKFSLNVQFPTNDGFKGMESSMVFSKTFSFKQMNESMFEEFKNGFNLVCEEFRTIPSNESEEIAFNTLRATLAHNRDMVKTNKRQLLTVILVALATPLVLPLFNKYLLTLLSGG